MFNEHRKSKGLKSLYVQEEQERLMPLKRLVNSWVPPQTLLKYHFLLNRVSHCPRNRCPERTEGENVVKILEIISLFILYSIFWMYCGEHLLFLFKKKKEQTITKPFPFWKKQLLRTWEWSRGKNIWLETNSLLKRFQITESGKGSMCIKFWLKFFLF